MSIGDIYYDFMETVMGSTLSSTPVGQLFIQYFTYIFCFMLVFGCLKFVKYLIYGCFGR